MHNNELAGRVHEVFRGQASVGKILSPAELFHVLIAVTTLRTRVHQERSPVDAVTQ